jgi:hypothetical protein
MNTVYLSDVKCLFVKTYFKDEIYTKVIATPELTMFTKKIGIGIKEDRTKKITRSIERPIETVKNHLTILFDVRCLEYLESLLFVKSIFRLISQ